MAVIPTPEQGKPILDFSAGTFDGNSNLFQSRNGATEHVNGDDVADYVNTSRIYNSLDTESKTPVSAINEINSKEASDIADVQAALNAINSTAAPLFYLGTYSYTAASVGAGENITISRTNFSISYPSGYVPIAIGKVGVSKAGYNITSFNVSGVSSVLSVRNGTSAAIANTTFSINIIYIKSDFLQNLT